MSKPPSEKTKLANERRLVKRLRVELMDVQRSMNAYRSRATKAEQELAERKARFDKLLERTPVTSSGDAA